MMLAARTERFSKEEVRWAPEATPKGPQDPSSAVTQRQFLSA